MAMNLDPATVQSALWPIQLSAEELSAFVESLNQPPRPAIRIRPELIGNLKLPFPTEPIAWHPQGRLVPDGTRPGATIEFAAGEFYIQEASSLLAIAVLDAQPGELICDLCAAPGGKSTAILESLDGAGWLLSNEAVKSRGAPLQFNLARHGAARYVVSSWDPDELARRLPEQFDAVLVDAPCSGQSLVARGKQTTAAFAPQTIEHCAARQTRILDSAAELVRPGGRLVYSTCTFSYGENEGQIESFLVRHADWKLESVPDSVLVGLGNSMSMIGARLWPHRHGSGGAFAACMRRTSDAGDVKSARSKVRESQLRPAALPSAVKEWGDLEDVSVFQKGLQCFAWPQDVPLELIAHAEAGPEVAFRKVSTWFPSYALAMRRDPKWTSRQKVDLSEEQAFRYLQGHPVQGDRTGWSIASWHGLSLGWLKGDGRQLKNHLPKGGRTR